MTRKLASLHPQSKEIFEENSVGFRGGRLPTCAAGSRKPESGVKIRSRRLQKRMQEL
jgi:hypothetical protein